MIDSYYQHRKCSAETLVCRDISRGIICGVKGTSKPRQKNVQCKTTHSHRCRHILARRRSCHSDVQTVCLHKYVTTISSPSPQFDVSFPAKLLKIVATRGEIFSLKFTKYRLAAGLCLDPLTELKRSPGPTSRNKGAYF